MLPERLQRARAKHLQRADVELESLLPPRAQLDGNQGIEAQIDQRQPDVQIRVRFEQQVEELFADLGRKQLGLKRAPKGQSFRSYVQVSCYQQMIARREKKERGFLLLPASSAWKRRLSRSRGGS